VVSCVVTSVVIYLGVSFDEGSSVMPSVIPPWVLDKIHLTLTIGPHNYTTVLLLF
jgi:hypothetical protein